MQDKISKIISVILHPMFTLTWAMLLMLNLDAYFVLLLPERLRWTIILLVFINTALIPALLIWLMARQKVISSLTMPLRQERTWPYLIFGVFYASTYFILRNLGLPEVYYMFIAGALASILIATVVNLWWKISIHMIGVGGLTGGFLALMYQTLINEPVLIMLLFLLSGITGFARLQTNTHSPAQVYVGYLTGVVIVAGMFLLL